MVRLKVNFKTNKDMKTKFQFHYGTIKSIRIYSAPVWRDTFQFHYGTIKSMLVFSGFNTCLNFNSTMVRLKVNTSAHSHRTACISIPLWYD